MYYEEAIVKTYFRKYKEKKVPFNQIHLKQDSKFNEDPEDPDVVGVIKLIDLKELLQKTERTELNELEAKYNKLLEEKLQLEQELQEVKATNETLTSDVKKYKEEKLQLQEDLLTEKNKNESLIETTNSKIEKANSNVIEAKDKIEQLQQEHKEELKEVNSDLKKATDKVEKLLILINSKDKDIVYLAERGLAKRIRNKLPERIESLVRKTKESEEVESTVNGE